MVWLKKKIRVPDSNHTVEAESIQLWEVRWQSRSGEFSGNTRQEVEAFPTIDEANAFAEALRNAFKLIRHTSGHWVTVKKG